MHLAGFFFDQEGGSAIFDLRGPILGNCGEVETVVLLHFKFASDRQIYNVLKFWYASKSNACLVHAHDETRC